MTTRQRYATTLFVFFCLLSAYSYGTAMMDYFLVYPSRFVVGAAEFGRYHELLEAAIIPISVVPFLVAILLNGIVLGMRPAGVSRALLAASLACLLLDLAATVLMQAPWNVELAKGKDVLLMQKISDTNWVRVALESAQAGLVLAMLRQLLLRAVAAGRTELPARVAAG
jgi:hypothetical protein